MILFFSVWQEDKLCYLNQRSRQTWGPPTMNSPQGLMWTIVLASRYLAGITSLMTFSLTCCLNSSRLTFSECWRETTTVCTRRGTQAPRTKQYSQVTCEHIKHGSQSMVNTDDPGKLMRWSKLANIQRTSFSILLQPKDG